MAALYSAERCGAVATVAGTTRPPRRRAAEPAGWEEAPGASPAVSREPRRDRRRSPATCSASASRSSRPTAPASTSPARASRSRSVSELTAGRRRSSAARSRRSTPRSTPASSPGATSRASSTSSREQGIGLIDIVVVNVKPFAPGGRRQARRHRRGDRDDRRRRRGAARRGGPQLRPASRRSPTRRTTRGHRASSASAASSRAELRASSSRPRRSARSPPTTPRSRPTSTRSPATSSRSRLAIVLEKVDDLRYGENPHQRAAFYRETTHRSGTLADATQLQGEPPSFNNLLDLDAAYRIARDYTAPTVAIVKHTDPVGLASHDELVEAYRHALETDPVAAFGGIVGVNRELDGATAREIAANSYEAVVAPGFSQAALGILRGEARPRAPRRPARPDRGDARLRHRQPRLQAGRRRPARRDASTSSGSIAASSRS